MTWNHRVIRVQEDGCEPQFYIHEVYYREDGSISGWIQDAIDVSSETKDGLRWTLEMMGKALEEPPLEEFDGKLREATWN